MGIDFIIPFIDLFYAFVFLPGVVLALFGHYYIVGPLTWLVMPLAFLIVLIMVYRAPTLEQPPELVKITALPEAPLLVTVAVKLVPKVASTGVLSTMA